MRFVSGWWGALLFAVASVLIACPGGGHSQCGSSSDCQTGDVCTNGMCVSPGLDAGSSDAGEPADGGAADAATTDAGVNDAGLMDAGSTDAGESDAGGSDGGVPDAGPSDAGPPPCAPTNVRATAGIHNALVTWTAPACGAPITGSTITSSGNQTQMISGSATRGYVAGLTAGTSYTFTVYATNAAGNGPPSSPSNAVTPIDCQAEGVEFSSNCPNGQICSANLCETPSYTVSSATTSACGQDNAVTDGVTGLVWERNGTCGTFTWDSTGQSTSSAQYYCAHLNLGGYAVGSWRLPTLDELFTLVQLGTHPPIDPTAFPYPADVAEAAYWTSVQSGSYVLGVWFGPSGTYVMEGSQTMILPSSPSNVRCVQ